VGEQGRERVPIKEGFFTVPDDPAEDPKIIGSKCRNCGEYFFPRRSVCARCNSRGLADTEMSGRGTVYSFTFVHMPMFGSTNVEYRDGYGVGQVDLVEGPRMQLPLTGKHEDLRVGLEVQAELDTVRQDKDGRDVVSLRFRPTESR
jgi:uncharacterized OB-fold protein